MNGFTSTNRQLEVNSVLTKVSNDAPVKTYTKKHVNGEECYVCSNCNSTYHLLKNFKEHSCSAQCPYKNCPKEFESSGRLIQNYEKHVVFINFPKFSCDYCHKVFSSKAHLASHIQQHVGPHHCEYCLSDFPSKEDLVKHIKAHHQQRYGCGKCGRKFNFRKSCLTHVRNHDKKPYTCPECQDLFRSLNELRGHQRRLHQNLKDFKCNQCGKAFPWKTFLEKHRFKNHFDDLMNNLCTQCGSSFYSPEELQEHKKVHEMPTEVSVP